MDRIASFITKHRKIILIIFSVSAIICAILQLFVTKNYDMIDYLPEEAQSTKALNIMTEEFTQSMPNTSVLIKNVSLMEAVEYKKQLAAIDGVSSVLWLDDMVDIKQPLEMSDPDTVDDFYKNGNALFSVTIAKGTEKETCAAIRKFIGEDNLLAGEVPDLATMQENTVTEVMGAMFILIPAVLLILFLSTTSWFEPVLFIATIGISILLNMGTNVFLGEISFMTGSISPILQLAVSLDYAIFLLHSFSDNRKKYASVDEAMHHAIKASIVTVAASALTTLFGFIALMFMKFGIGADLGLNLAKGIILSFITTMIFLPALTLSVYKYIDKTKHKQFMPSFTNINRVLSKFAIPVVALVILLIIPGYLGQRETGFEYGNASSSKSNRSGLDRLEIEKEFGKSTVMVLLVPRGDVAKEQNLAKDLNEIPHITSVMSYSNTVGTAIPPEYLGEDIAGQFYSDHYARIILYTDTVEEGDIAFNTVEKVQNTAKTYYGDSAYSLGQSANLFDMKNIVTKDNTMVNLIAIISIFLVLLFSFKSLTLPFILLITIEAGIWFNLSMPYFVGTTISFIGYLVLSTVQLGATVDYAILLTDRYLTHRKENSKRIAIHQALGETFKSILVSAATLSIAGFTLYVTSTNSSAADIGMLLCRGTIFSFIMVTCFLPAMLLTFDQVIAKTTYKSTFAKAKHTDEPILDMNNSMHVQITEINKKNKSKD
ncbi:MAG: transporter [Anaerocolumna sp.]|jgi:predicted RND superfamily exporter protein|nr:transporter [Anaerocolumna sp.]